MRRVIQLMQEPRGSNLLALCDDGTIWRILEGGMWSQLPAIPQEQEPPKEKSSKIIYRTSEGDFRRIDYRSLVGGDLYLSVDGSSVNEAVWAGNGMIRIIVERI